MQQQNHTLIVQQVVESVQEVQVKPLGMTAQVGSEAACFTTMALT
jgi:putative transposon-encoded protein